MKWRLVTDKFAGSWYKISRVGRVLPVVNRLAPLMGDRYGEHPYRSLIQSRAGRRPSKSQLPLRPRFSRRLLSAGATSRPSPPLEDMLNRTAGRDFLAEKASRYAFLNLADTDRSFRFALPTQLGVVPIHASLQEARLPSRAFFASEGSLCKFDTTCGSPHAFQESSG